MLHDEAIHKALSEGSALKLGYKNGEPRTVIPRERYTDKSGDDTLLCWQVSGSSGTGWRAFHIFKITSASAAPKPQGQSAAPDSAPPPSLAPHREQQDQHPKPFVGI